jgi:hypothetical protein
MALLLEDGSALLLEDGTALLLEGDEVIPADPPIAPGRGNPDGIGLFEDDDPDPSGARIY